MVLRNNLPSSMVPPTLLGKFLAKPELMRGRLLGLLNCRYRHQ